MYRISTNHDGEKRWWRPYETIPTDHYWRRDATAEEAALMDEILDGNGAFDGARMNAAADKLRQILAAAEREHPMAVVVCTDKRGVVFGYTTDATARPIQLMNARMCLYWSADVGGVFGLADIGPTKGCKISAQVPAIVLEGITAVMLTDEKAEKAWIKAPVQGR